MRKSGVLLHITSLPSADYVGNLGPGAYRFIDFLARAGHSLWQILPINPSNPGEGNSPYSCVSAFAGSPLLISPELLIELGLISPPSATPGLSGSRVDYGAAIDYKFRILDNAYETFSERQDKSDYEQFCQTNSFWLDDFALFVSLKEFFDGQSWEMWPENIRNRNPETTNYYKERLDDPIRRHKFRQFVFFSQWRALKEYASRCGIEIMGDLPIYTSYQSADVWSHPEIYKLDESKKPIYLAGVPPDYFSETGQLWGNPVYDWDRLRKTGFDWWIRRLRHNLGLFDSLRIDHFRGLVAYWEIPADHKTAVNGVWITIPFDDFFAKLKEHFPSFPIVAEDLGLITPDVRELIARLGIPGMKVLLFAFGDGLPTNPYAPHNHIRNCVVYTGTHDNNTVRGWFEGEATPIEIENLRRYLGYDVNLTTVNDAFMRMAMMSVADTVVFPMQDILGLGAEARMNIPSTASGNWKWRLEPHYLSESLASKLRDMTELYGRLPDRNRD